MTEDNILANALEEAKKINFNVWGIKAEINGVDSHVSFFDVGIMGRVLYGIGEAETLEDAIATALKDLKDNS